MGTPHQNYFAHFFTMKKNLTLHVETKPLKTTDDTMESDILKLKKKSDILYVFQAFIMSIVFATKIS